MTSKKRLELNKSKLRWHGGRVKAWRERFRIAPITVDLALTQSCNYKCVYCYGQLQQQPDLKSWTWDMIRTTFDDFAEIGVKAVSLISDGESTCNRRYVDAIRHARLNGLDVALGTNGYLLDYEMLERILPNLTYLRFNISAASEKLYEKVHGTKHLLNNAYLRVLQNVRDAVAIKQERNLDCTIGLQMVLMPSYIGQVIPLTYLAQGLGVDYLQIKHCSDDEKGSLGIDYHGYELFDETLYQAEALGNDEFQVIVKWDKIKAGNKRQYKACLAPPFQLQISGSGLVAPCGMFFHQRYFRYHIGSLHSQRFKDLWKSDRYWDVMETLAGPTFNAQVACGCLCLQDASNIYLNDLMVGKEGLARDDQEPPAHINFI